MARKRRDTGSRQGLSRRRRVWQQFKNGYQKARALDWGNWIKTGAAVITVTLTFWTNHIRMKADDTARKLSDLQAALVQKDKEYAAQMVTVSNKVDSCEKRMRESDERLERIEKAAKKLKDGPVKREILTLTKREPLKTGAVLPMRADEPLLPSFLEVVPHVKRGLND